MIFYLIKNRSRQKVLSKIWFKIWLKRLWHLTGLFVLCLRRLILIIKGAKIAELTVLGKIEINGINSKLTIGKNSFIGTGTHLALHNYITIGNKVVINNDVKLLTASHDVKDPQWKMFSKEIIIDDYAWIATGAIILAGVKIGYGAVVGAGSVVTKDVPPYSIVAGNPARLVNKRTTKLNYNPVQFCAPYEAWLGSDKLIKN